MPGGWRRRHHHRPGYTYTLTIAGSGEDSNATGDQDVTSDLTINGAAADTTVIDGRAIDRVFHIASGATVQINDVTITNGSTNLGGGIKNDGTLTLSDSTVRDNSGGNAGGGIQNDGTTTVNNTTITLNSASFSDAAFAGGGIENGTDDTLNIRNRVVADNSPGGDCGSSRQGTSLGYNLDSDGTCGFSATGDVSGATAQLGPLQDNGGPTFTHALLSSSPAIDAGNPATPGSGGNACESTDQRGTTRPQDTVCDIGAFELLSATAVPGLSGWGLIALAGLLAIAFAWRLRRRTATGSRSRLR